MKRVVLVAATTGYQTRAFDEASRAVGVELVLATDRCHVLEDPWGDDAVAIRFDEPEASAERIPACDGILAVADRPALVAALAADRLGLHFHSSAAAAACLDKSVSRERFRAAGLPAPESYRVDGRVRFPCVLKPVGLSASRGVIRANNEAEFRAAFARIRAMWDGPVVVESFIPGREYALEGLMTGGELKVLAIFDKPDPLDGPFFEETIYVTPSRENEATQRAMVETARAAARALGLRHGPIHAEMRVNERGVYMLEVAARPIGGLCAKAIRLGSITLEELLLRHAIGEDVSAMEREECASGVMMIPIPRDGIYEETAGIEAARSVLHIEEVIITAKRGQRVVPLPEGASYLGFIFARAGSAMEVERALREAHGKLTFTFAAVLKVI